MGTPTLQAKEREQGNSLSTLRQKGCVPCILYGFGVSQTQLQCGEQELSKACDTAGNSVLLDLHVGEKHFPILLKAIQRDPVSDRPIHADFYAVNMQKEIETSIPVRLEGTSPAIKDHGGILVSPLTHVRVKCLPASLPQDLPLSVESMMELHSMLTVANLTLPPGVRVLDPPDSVLAIIQEIRIEEEAAPTTPLPTETEGGAIAADGSAGPTTSEKGEGNE